MSQTEEYDLPTKRLQDLPLNDYYQICKHHKVHTKYGEAVLAYLLDEDTEERFKVFLPKRFTAKTDLLDDYECLAFGGVKKTNNNFNKHMVHLKGPKHISNKVYQRTL